jgi:hypothetical protein
MSLTVPSSADVIPFRPKSYLKLNHELLRGTVLTRPALEQALFVRIASRFNGKNNGAIPYSVRDARAELHIGQSTAYRAFHGLQKARLIVCRKPGNRTGPSEWEIPELGGRCTRPSDVCIPLQVHRSAGGVPATDTKREEKTLRVEKDQDSENLGKEGSGESLPTKEGSKLSDRRSSSSISLSHHVAAGTAAMAALELIESATRRPFRRDGNGSAWVSPQELEAITTVAARRARP